MTTRRSFLSSILAAGMAPAIVKAGILMPIAPRIWVPNPQEFRIYNTYPDRSPGPLRFCWGRMGGG